jgi:hypothetical protein
VSALLGMESRSELLKGNIVDMILIRFDGQPHAAIGCIRGAPPAAVVHMLREMANQIENNSRGGRSEAPVIMDVDG